MSRDVSTFISARIRVMVFNATFNNISVIWLGSVLLVHETRVPGENLRRASDIHTHWRHRRMGHGFRPPFFFSTPPLFFKIFKIILNDYENFEKKGGVSREKKGGTKSMLHAPVIGDTEIYIHRAKYHKRKVIVLLLLLFTAYILITTLVYSNFFPYKRALNCNITYLLRWDPV